MLGNARFIFVLEILKTNPFSHHQYKCNFIQNLDFLRFFVYLWNDSNQFFFKFRHIIFIMYIIMSETFIKVDSLQHLEISGQTYPTNLSKICTCHKAGLWRYLRIIRVIYNFSFFLINYHLLSLTFTNFNPQPITGENFIAIGEGKKYFLRRLRNIGMAPE